MERAFTEWNSLIEQMQSEILYLMCYRNFGSLDNEMKSALGYQLHEWFSKIIEI